MDVIGLGLLIGKDDGLTIWSTIDTDYVSNGRHLLVFGLEDNLKMLDST